MAYSELLADRVRRVFQQKHVAFEEKKMMGGICFLVDDKMCAGVHEARLMARLDPTVEAEALTRPGCHPMDFTGRPMKGYVFFYPEGTDRDNDLESWVQWRLDFNPKAKSGKKKK
jgi:TfoX/Sxy family transcriptional regulator of competence genes